MGKNRPPHRPGRPHRIPPRPLPPEESAHQHALAEIAGQGGALWRVLWQACRDVWLWASVSPEDRAELFSPPGAQMYEWFSGARDEAPELAAALGTFHLLRWSPQTVEAVALGEACHQVSEWADSHSLTALAAHFADAAASADPTDPVLAHTAAYLYRRAYTDWRAAAWYERAFRLAVWAGHRDTAVGALIGYGALLYGLGLYDRARRYLERGARRAVRTGRQRKAAEAHHDLAGLCLDMGDFASAMDHARCAGELYPLRHPRIPALVHDFAVVLVRQHHYTTAYSLLAKLPPYFRDPEATLVWSTLARVTAGMGQVERFGDPERRTLDLVALYKEHGAAALVNLTEGARALRRWNQAEEYAHMAIEIARERSDAGQERSARALLEKVGRRELPLPEVPASVEAASLARRLAARLRRWKGGGPESRFQKDGGGEDPPPS